ncbi:unnamed protein product [Caenorhabditis auriculariae]|uniref:Cell morphogenesis protein N-terminal domain-containing protein n=1 Tax=Caenorhabditis auriculariae TaxID=2777116 RepID=A0A8S1GX26_9PELO|nr:unnamed protein product [Caenorhabditis auriculariae]
MALAPKKVSRRKSDPGTITLRANAEKSIATCELPWGGVKIVALTPLEFNQPSGSFVGQAILLDMFNLFNRKLTAVVEDEPLEKLLNKTLQRGGDPYFDNLCRALNGICEVCLPSVLQVLLKWYEHMEENLSATMTSTTLTNENRLKLAKKLLAVNYLFCLVLIEILPQLEFHAVSCENFVRKLLDICFRNIQYKDISVTGINNTNHLLVAEAYGEVIGVLSLTYFTSIHRIFMNMLNDLRKDSSPLVPHQMIALIMAMKFVKIKTNQVEDFEMGVKFLDDLGTFLLEVKDKDVKHAVTGLLVEILLPVAAQIKRETNIPSLIALVTKLYGPTNEMASKKHHKLAAYPLQTCLLCVSQRQFFLTNWVPFLNVTLANLKNRDSKLSRVALESLYRLLWVYMIRNNSDGNTATRSRLESICGSLFPKGNRSIVPRDAPLNIFVKIIHFIAQQKLDFAFKDVIFDLLCCNRTQRSLYAERMNIGIRALMVIADGLQQKDEPPAMPKSMGPSASGTIQKIRKKTYITRPLTAEIAKSIGLEQYYTPCRKAFDSILRTLDTQIGKPLMMPLIHGRGKEPEELMSGDTKPKLDLFRTCIAAIPRLLPEPMSHTELIDILTRLTVHIDEELRNMAGLTLQNMIGEFPDWREHVFVAQVQLLQSQISDFFPNVLDDALRLLLQLLTTWKTAAGAERKKQDFQSSTAPSSIGSSSLCSLPENVALSSAGERVQINYAPVLHSIEGLALVYLCQNRSQPRKLAIQLLKEVKTIIGLLAIENTDTPVITVLDNATPYVVKKYIEHVPLSERMAWTMEFASVCEKIGSIETDNCLVNSDKGNEYLQWDAWACALSGYSERKHLLTRCPTAIMTAWPILFARLNAVSGYVDPNNPQNESRASLLRGSKSKGSSAYGEALGQDGCLSLWQKYLILCCALAPSPQNCSTLPRSFSPTNSFSISMDASDVFRSVSSSIRSSRGPLPTTLSQLLSKLCTILRWENMTDIRDSVILGVGSMNPYAFDSLMEELKACGILREAMEKKVETNLRRRRRKDLLRLQIIRLIEIAVFRGLLEVSMIDSSGALNSTIVEFIDSMRVNLASDHERDLVIVTQLRLHLAKLIVLIIDSTPPFSRSGLLSSEKRQNLFYLFIGWCSRSITAGRKCKDKEVGSYVEQKSILAMTRILCCGPIFEANKSIGEDGYLYGWLEEFVTSNNATMQAEVEELLAWVLELNESSNILDWLMAQCYQQTPTVACRCFKALVRVFSRRDFPCEFVSLFVLCQSMLAGPSTTDCAVHMIEMLRKQFLDSSSALQATSPIQPVHFRSTANIISTQIGHSLPIEQQKVCRRLANAYPHLTVTIFSEVSYRLESTTCSSRAQLLALLQPWIANLELVDPNVVDEALEGPRGWGSEEATQLVLNNLLHLTATFGADHEKELGELWKSLAVSFPANLPAILNYFYTVTLLSQDTLLPVMKRVCVIISDVVGNRLATLLLEWLSGSQDSVRVVLERSDIPPFYRWRDDSVDRKEKSDAPSSPLRDSQELKDETIKDGVRLLPMPAYGGHYSQLSTLLPPTTHPVQFFNKSEVGLLLVCDIIRAASDVDWSEATPVLLHAGVLSLDSLRPALCRHARQTIINVCLLFVDKTSLTQVSSILLKNEMVQSHADGSSDLTGESAVAVARGESPSFARAAADEYRTMLLENPCTFSSSSDLVAAIVFCLSENMDWPLWANEDATPRNWRVPSAAQLTCLVQRVAQLLIGNIPMVAIMWTQLAMRMALATSQRHSAGRCFQIVSALRQPPGAWVPSLMSRLVETAGEQHEETQAYVTDLLICLIDSASNISPSIESVIIRGSISPTHARSTSYTPALVRQSVLCSRVQHQHDKKDARLSLLVSDKESWSVATEKFVRSKSADQLKTDLEADEEVNARTQMCAIALALLESGLDNEFLLALNLLDKVLDMGTAQKLQCLHKLDKMIAQLEWKNFDGIVSLVIRGSVVSIAYEASIQALIRLCDVLDEDVVGGHDSIALFVAHTLPYMLLNFDNPNSLAIDASNAIAAFCRQEVQRVEKAPSDHPFIHLATVMSQYASKSFQKDGLQFAKCVLQYICDGVMGINMDAIVCLLAEILERGWSSMQGYVLHMIFLLVQHSHNTALSPLSLNAQVIRSVSRHLQGVHWKEASRVCKAVVEKLRDEATVTAIAAGIIIEGGIVNCLETGSMLDLLPAFVAATSKEDRAMSPHSPRKTIDGPPFAGASTLRRLPPAHIRVRDHLVGVLSASGLRIGIPSATSLVFSRSELGSAASSTDRIDASSQEIASSASLADPAASITDSFPRVFKEFDFLEAEHDSVSETTDSCFGWLSTMRATTRSGENGDDRHSVTRNYDDEENEDEESETHTTSQDDPSLGRFSRSSIDDEEERTPCPSEGCDVDQDDDDVLDGSACDEEEALRIRLGSAMLSSSHLEHIQDTSIDGSSVCAYSHTSVTGDYYPNRVRTLSVQCLHHLDGKVENDWTSAMSELNDDVDGETTAFATLIAAQVYKASCGNVCDLLRDASHLLSNRSLSRSFINAQEALAKVVDFPFLFITEQFMRGSPLLQRLKLSLYELKEHWETFHERKEQCQKALNSLRSAYKLSALGGSTASLSSSTELDVGRLLNKLLFQVMLMSDSLKDMTNVVKNSTNSQVSTYRIVSKSAKAFAAGCV